MTDGRHSYKHIFNATIQQVDKRTVQQFTLEITRDRESHGPDYYELQIGPGRAVMTDRQARAFFRVLAKELPRKHSATPETDETRNP